MSKLTHGFVSVALMFVLTSRAAEDAQQILVRLDRDLEAVVTFEDGDDGGPLRAVEAIVMDAAHGSELHRAVEQRIVKALTSAKTLSAKGFLCRQLFTVGTAASVPALEGLLPDGDVSHMACFALARIDAPDVDAALRRALGKTKSDVRAAIVNALAQRQCVQAVPAFIELLASSDPVVCEAAAAALGRVGGTDAVNALNAALAKAVEPLKSRVQDALLACGDRLLAQGNPADAARIYATFYAEGQPRYLRLAGLRGLVDARGTAAVPLLVETIRSGEADLQRSAIAFMTGVKGTAATRAFADLLPSLAPEAQALVLRALGLRGDASASETICLAVKSEQATVREAALAALGTAGDVACVPMLVTVSATADGPERDAARASLVALQAEGVSERLSEGASSGESKKRIECIRALAGRRSIRASGVLMAVARDADAGVRREAIRALGVVTATDKLKELVALSVSPADAGDGPTCEQAVGTALKRLDSPERQAAILLEALSGAPATARPLLLRLMVIPATPAACDAVRAAVAGGDAAARDAAVRTLATWPNTQPTEELLRLARESDDETHKVLALRGYVRLAGMSEDPTAMYVRAIEVAKRPEDRRLALSGLGSADSLQALELTEKYLDDDQYRTEAALAAIQIAGRLREREPERVRVSLERILTGAPGEAVREKAQEMLNEFDKFDGHILSWVVAGPYQTDKKDGRDVYTTRFAPEKEGDAVEWRLLDKGVGSWDVNLEAMFGGMDYCAAYVRTSVESPVAQDVRLELGSDDALKVWLNGALIQDAYVNRGLSPRSDLVKAKLRQGRNTLVMKVVDHSGGWSFACRIRKPDGGALDGLKIEAGQ